DLKDPRGRDAFLALAQRADAIVESFRPGVVSNLSVDYATIAKINPRIVYASISGYGQTGPRSQAAGHDINYLGYAGVLDQTGMRNGPPALCNLQIADLLGGGPCAAHGKRPLRGRRDGGCLAGAQHLRTARAVAVGPHVAAGRGPADGRRPLLRRLWHPGRPLARRWRARRQVLAGAARRRSTGRPSR